MEPPNSAWRYQTVNHAMNSLNYKNKTVVVTGCYSGIGNALCRLLPDLGAEVIGIDIRRPSLPLASFHAADFRDQSSLLEAQARITGPVHALFNCAGLGPSHPPGDVLRVNFLAARVLTESLIPRMEAGAAIASIGSIGGLAWPQHLASALEFLAIESADEALDWYAIHGPVAKDAYCFSKELIAVWTRQCSASLIRAGIRINCSSPGATRTPMLDTIEASPTFSGMDVITRPSGRCSSPEEQAWPLIMLNSELCSYVNGADLAVDGGGAALAALAVAG